MRDFLKKAMHSASLARAEWQQSSFAGLDRLTGCPCMFPLLFHKGGG
jgi:hypothetical protein